VTKVSKRRWPSVDEVMRTIERGVFDDSEFDLLRGDEDERAPSAPPPKRPRPRRATASPSADRGEQPAAG
jgi:hypothetical protein